MGVRLRVLLMYSWVQDASLGARAPSDAGQAHGLEDTTVDPSGRSRTEIDMAVMSVMLDAKAKKVCEEHRENDENPEIPPNLLQNNWRRICRIA